MSDVAKEPKDTQEAGGAQEECGTKDGCQEAGTKGGCQEGPGTKKDPVVATRGCQGLQSCAQVNHYLPQDLWGMLAGESQYER